MLRAPELDAGLPVGSHQSRVEGQNPLPQPAGHTSLDAAEDTVGLLGCEHTLVAHVQLFIHQYPQVFLIRAALNPFIRQPLLIGLPRPMCRTLRMALLNMRFTWAHISSLSRSLWMKSCPSGVSAVPLRLVSYADLLKVHLVLLSMWLMKILNTGPSMDPWGTPLFTGLHLDTLPCGHGPLLVA